MDEVLQLQYLCSKCGIRFIQDSDGGPIAEVGAKCPVCWRCCTSLVASNWKELVEHAAAATSQDVVAILVTPSSTRSASAGRPPRTSSASSTSGNPQPEAQVEAAVVGEDGDAWHPDLSSSHTSTAEASPPPSSSSSSNMSDRNDDQILAGSNDVPQPTLLAVSVPLLLARLPELQRGSEAFAPALHQADVKGRFRSPTPVEIIDALPRSYAADLHAAAGAAGPCCGLTLSSDDIAAADAPACSTSAGGRPGAGSSRSVRVLDTPPQPGCGCGKAGSAGWDNECVICTEGMAGRQVCISLPCGHSFHDRCILPWLSQHCTCPMCRYNVKLPPKHLLFSSSRALPCSMSAGSLLAPAGPSGSLESTVSCCSDGSDGSSDGEGPTVLRRTLSGPATAAAEAGSSSFNSSSSSSSSPASSSGGAASSSAAAAGVAVHATGLPPRQASSVAAVRAMCARQVDARHRDAPLLYKVVRKIFV